MRLIFVFLLFIAALSTACAQALYSSVQAEYTVSGVEFGGGILAASGKGYGMGMFYQSSSVNTPELHKSSFYGLEFQAPLAKSPNLSFYANVRAGLTANRFAVIAPGLETQVTLTRRISLGFRMGLRMNYPSFSGKIMVKLSGNN